jgi:hypothetical protein
MKMDKEMELYVDFRIQAFPRSDIDRRVLQTVTPSKARRQAEADRRREVKEQRKAQIDALEGKRGGLEKQKVRCDAGNMIVAIAYASIVT